MVYKVSDLKHLTLMASLEEQTVQESDVKEILALDEPVSTDASLSKSLMTLCNKLRLSGLEQYAASIESKFVMYKSAETHLYRAVDEDGEDLINFAHPDGDAKTGDAQDNNADVETILSKHKKIVDIVNKVPTGKFAFASINREIINSVKVALGQATPQEKKLHKEIEFLLNKVSLGWSFIDNLVRTTGGLINTPGGLLGGRGHTFNSVSDEIKNSLSSDPDLDDLKKIIGQINMMKETLEPGWSGGVKDATWIRIKDRFAPLNTILTQVIARRTYLDKLESDRESAAFVSEPQEQTDLPKSNTPQQSQLQPVVSIARTNQLAQLNKIKLDVANEPGPLKYVSDYILNIANKTDQEVDAAIAKMKEAWYAKK